MQTTWTIKHKNKTLTFSGEKAPSANQIEAEYQNRFGPKPQVQSTIPEHMMTTHTEPDTDTDDSKKNRKRN